MPGYGVPEIYPFKAIPEGYKIRSAYPVVVAVIVGSNIVDECASITAWSESVAVLQVRYFLNLAHTQMFDNSSDCSSRSSRLTPLEATLYRAANCRSTGPCRDQ